MTGPCGIYATPPVPVGIGCSNIVTYRGRFAHFCCAQEDSRQNGPPHRGIANRHFQIQKFDQILLHRGRQSVGTLRSPLDENRS